MKKKKNITYPKINQEKKFYENNEKNKLVTQFYFYIMSYIDFDYIIIGGGISGLYTAF